MAAYTRSRHEGRVKQYCEERGIAVFLPSYRTWRRWSDRKKLLRLPLFPSYVFVKASDIEQHSVVRAPGFLWYVRNRNGPVEVSGEEIEGIRRLLDSGLEFDPLPGVQVGDEVEIVAGPLRGCRGFLLRKNMATVVMQISAIQASVRVRVLEPEWIRKTAHRGMLAPLGFQTPGGPAHAAI